MSSISVQDKNRAAFLEALGLTSSSLTNPDLERQALLDAAGLTVSTGSGLTNSDLRRLANYSLSDTFTGFEFDPIKGIPGLVAYYRADRIAGQTLVSDTFDRSRNLMAIFNPSFESGTTGWSVSGSGTITLTQDTTTAVSGNASGKVVCDGTSGLQGFNGPIVSSPNSRIVTISFNAKASIAGASYISSAVDRNGANAFIRSNDTIVTLSTEWQRFTRTVTLGADAEKVSFRLRTSPALATTIWLDNVQIEEGSTATAFTWGDASNLGVADTGQQWSVFGNVMGVSGGRTTTASVLAPFTAVTDCGSYRKDISTDISYVEVGAESNGIGVTLSYIDTNNFIQAWMVLSTGALTVRRSVNGVTSDNASTGAGAMPIGTYSFRATLIDNTVTVYGFNTTYSYTLSAAEQHLSRSTLCGPRTSNVAAVKFDNFTVKVPTLTDGALVGIWPDLSGNNRHAIQNTFSPPNLLTQNQATVETDTTGLAAFANCTVARTTAQFAEGTASLECTVTATGTFSAGLSNTTWRPVTPGLTYTGFVSTRANTVGRTGRAILIWGPSSGAYASQSNGVIASNSATAWTDYSVTAVAPAGANFVNVIWEDTDGTTLAGEIHYLDKLGIFQGSTGTTWRAPNDPSGFLSRPLLRTQNPNLLTYNQATIETSAEGNAFQGTPSRVTTQAAHGSACLQLVTTAASYTDYKAHATANAPMITAGKVYTAICSVRSDSISRFTHVFIRWYDSGNTLISDSASGAVLSSSTTAWGTRTCTASAPANAAKAVVVAVIGGANSGETHYFDNFGLFEGTVTEWMPPVTIPNGRAAVQFDGVTDFLITTTIPRSQNATLFIVAASNQPNRLDQRMLYWRGNNGPYLNIHGLTRQALARNSDATFPGVGTNLVAPTNFAVQVGTYTDGQVVAQTVNGTPSPGATGNYVFSAENAAIQLGGNQAVISQATEGQIVAAIVYDRALTDAERKKVEKYLGTQFGITVAA